MRKISFVNKLTIWYSIILLIIAVGSMFAVSQVSHLRAREASMAQLVEQVAETEDKITSSGKDFEFRRGIRFYIGNIYISVYDEDGELIEGKWPADMTAHPSFDDRKKQIVSDEKGHEWYIYDSVCQTGDRTLWIRGITAGDDEFFSSELGKNPALIAMALLMVIAVLIGRVIALRSLKPVRNVIATVEDINSSGDLSKRVEEGTQDDIGQLAANFNNLFDRVETMVNKEKQFTADISHELKTPLAVIISQSDYALEDEEYQKQALQTIKKEAKRMSEMIGRLRLLAGSDSGGMQLQMETIDFSEICSSILEQQKLLGESRDREISGSIEKNIMITGDTTMIINAVLNLMDNAFKYSSPGCRISLDLRTEGSDALCTVEDNGRGISPENIDRIWDRFYRENSSRSNRDSSGLGLSLVKAIVEAHGGSVSVSSREGKGSRFTIRLQREVEDDD